MRKIICILTSVLLLVCAVGFAACDETSEEESTVEKVTLCGFENNRELLSIAYYNVGGGKIDLCDDPAYVTSGDACAKMTMETPVREEKGDDLTLTFVTGTSFLPKTNYTDTVAFELDLYSDYEAPVQTMLTIDTSNYMWYGSVEPGWNHFTIPLSRESYDLSSVSTIDLWFEGKPANVEEPYVFYLDSFVAVTVEERVYQKELDYSGTTPFTFSNEYDVYGLMSNMGAAASDSRFAYPRYSLNRDPHYILNGTGSMKVEFFPNEAGTDVVGVGFRTVRGTESVSWNEFDYETTYLTYDVYNASEQELQVGIALFTKIDEVYRVNTVVPANSWSDPYETRLLLQDMLDQVTGTELDIMTIVIYVDGYTAEGGALYLDNISFKSAQEFGEV